MRSRINYYFLFFAHKIYFLLCEKAPLVIKYYYKINIRLFQSKRDRILLEYSRKTENFFVFQIGANDGFIGDPIHKFIFKFGWRGILIEPQPFVFHNYLLKTYAKQDQIFAINCAIGEIKGSQPLYSLSFSNHRWATGLSSFSKSGINNLLSNGYIQKKAKQQGIGLPEIEDCIIENIVEVMTFEDLLQSHEVKKIDLLQIDAEGYDGKLISIFPFSKYKPIFINFEHSHMKQTEYNSICLELNNHGYELTKIENDTFCFLNPKY